MDRNPKDVVFFGRTKEVLSQMPDQVKRDIGHNLEVAQIGQKGQLAKPLGGQKEFKGAKVMEIVSDFSTDTFRGVYTVEHPEAIYVVDVFQKKSKRGSETPQQDIDRIIERLKKLREYRATPTGKALIENLNLRSAARQIEIDKRKAKINEPK